MIMYSTGRGFSGRTGAAQITTAPADRKLPPVSDGLILSDPLVWALEYYLPTPCQL
jgi:hypothetical protein